MLFVCSHSFNISSKVINPPFSFIIQKSGRLLKSPVACGEEVHLELHCFPEGLVWDIDIQPRCRPSYIIAVYLYLIRLVLFPSRLKQRTVWDGDVFKMSMEFTMVNYWHISNERHADCSSIPFRPVPLLEANMVSILS